MYDILTLFSNFGSFYMKWIHCNSITTRSYITRSPK